jgi:hypothetical protein
MYFELQKLVIRVNLYHWISAKKAISYNNKPMPFLNVVIYTVEDNMVYFDVVDDRLDLGQGSRMYVN